MVFIFFLVLFNFNHGGFLMDVLNHWRNPIQDTLKALSPTAWEIMHDRLKIFDLRPCDYDGLFYPRCEMVLTGLGLVARRHAVKLSEPDCCGNEYECKYTQSLNKRGF
jgi:hypothetical protein